MVVVQSISTDRSMTVTEWAMLITLAMLWGGSFFFNGVAVRELPVLTVVVSRVALAALILMAILRLKSEKMPNEPRVWLAFLGMGILNNVVPFTFIVWGQQHIASAVASILNASTPLFAVIFAHFLTTDERLTFTKSVGVLFGFVGVAVMLGFDEVQTLGTNVVAQLMCLGAAVSYALAGIFGRRFRSLGVTPLQTATGQVLASSAILIPLMLIVDRPWTHAVPSLSTIGALLGVAALSTALAYVFYFRILSTAGATNLMLVTLLIPLSATVLGILFLGEILSPKHIMGMALVGGGLAVLDGRFLVAVRRRCFRPR